MPRDLNAVTVDQSLSREAIPITVRISALCLVIVREYCDEPLFLKRKQFSWFGHAIMVCVDPQPQPRIDSISTINLSVARSIIQIVKCIETIASDVAVL